MHVEALTRRLDALLPQTQCTRCGYPRCLDYARAVAAGQADINRCPPGGDVTLLALAQALGVASKPLDPAVGPRVARQLAFIDEARCIGCRKCLDVCPVDAIVGARKLMHTVIAAQCTGCELCLPPCPVDCIALMPVVHANPEGPWPEYVQAEADAWRMRTEARLARLARRRVRRDAARAERPSETPTAEQMRAEIKAAVDRVRQKRRAAPASTKT